MQLNVDTGDKIMMIMMIIDDGDKRKIIMTLNLQALPPWLPLKVGFQQS